MSSRSHHGRLWLGLLLTVACGNDPRQVDEAGSEPVADGGTQSADDAGLEDSGDAAIEPLVEPPAAECGVVRRFPISTGDSIVRAPGGFVVGPWFSHSAQQSIEWFAIAEDGRRKMQLTGTRSRDVSLALFPIGPDPFEGNLLNVMPRGAGPDERVVAELIASSAPGPSQVLGPAFYRGTIQKAGAVSLDGMRMVYATGHVIVDRPHAFVVDERGARVGDAVTLSESEDPSFTCLDVVPTEHGAVVSFIDSEQRVPAMRLVEIGPDARVLQDVTVESGGSLGCPSVYLAQRGLWVSVPGVAPDTFDLLAVDAGQVAVRESGLPRAPGWVGESASGELLYLIGSRLSRRGPNNDWVDVPGDLPDLGPVIASEPGRLFVTSPISLQDNGELLEIACSDLPRLTLAR